LLLQPFGVEMFYLDRKENSAMEKLGVQLEKDIDEFLGKCDVVRSP